MKRKRAYCATCVILALAMLLVLPSCSLGKGKTKVSGSKAVIQIDVFSASTASTSAAGVYASTWWGGILKDKVGVSLNVLPTGDQAEQKLQALMAGGELPDITIFQNTTDVQSAVRGNMIIDLDKYMSKLPDVKKNASTALQYSRDNLSNGKGQAYVITSSVGPADASATEPSWGPYLRWDLYTQIGSPVINTFDDYLAALKKMQQLEPKAADGSKTYGITLWKDWDNYSMFMAQELGPTIGIDCGDQLSNLPFLQVDFNTGKTENILDPDSQYIQALKFYYKANQMGLVDPDSLTQTYATAKAKITAGSVFFSWWSWLNDTYNTTANTNAAKPTGFAAVLPTNTKSLVLSNNEVGKGAPIAISSATKNLDACLKYVNFMYSTDGLQSLFNGPKGVTWNTDSSGKPTLTDSGRDYVNTPTKELPQGGTLGDGINLLGFNGLSTAFVNPLTKEAIDYTYWASTKNYNLTNQTSLQKEWSTAMGYSTTLDYLKAKNMTLALPLAQSLIPSMPDDISSTASSIGDIIKTDSWKMVFAKNDAEFQKDYNDMKTKADGLGLNTVYSWSLKGWGTAKALANKYQ